MLLQTVKQIEERKKQGISDDFRVEAIGGCFVPVAVGEQERMSRKRGFQRLLPDWHDSDMPKEFLQVEVVISLEVDDFDFWESRLSLSIVLA